MRKALTIEARQEPDCTVVTIGGEIDTTTVAGLRERLFELAASSRPLVTDLDQVSFIDSTRLGVLVGKANRAASHGGALQVVFVPQMPGRPTSMPRPTSSPGGAGNGIGSVRGC